jgi:hypothetical protein
VAHGCVRRGQWPVGRWRVGPSWWCMSEAGAVASGKAAAAMVDGGLDPH